MIRIDNTKKDGLRNESEDGAQGSPGENLSDLKKAEAHAGCQKEQQRFRMRKPHAGQAHMFTWTKAGCVPTITENEL